MIEASLGQIAQMCGGTLLQPQQGTKRIKGVSTDTRTISSGCLFVPLIGERFNAHDFVVDAMMKGANAVLWQADQGEAPAEANVIQVSDTLQALQQLAHHYRKSLPVRVIGVTGSNGKTTTKDLLAGMVSGRYMVLKTKGNLNNHIGLPLMMLQLQAQTEVAILEMGMSARGEIEWLSRLAEPEAAIITHIGESHMEHLGSQRGIAEAKMEIVHGMPPNSTLIIPSGLQVLEDVIREHGHLPQGMRIIRVGKDAECEYAAASVEWLENPARMRVQPRIQGQLSNQGKPLFAFEVPLLGDHHVRNSLLAYAAAKWLGMRDVDIAKGMTTVQMTAMRSQLQHAPRGWTVVNDAYNASPSSVKAAIETLRAVPGRRRSIVVLGDMLELGEAANELHAEIGQFMQPSKETFVFLYGPLMKAAAEAANVNYPEGFVQHFVDKSQLLIALSDVLMAGDWVLVKGSRGMKMEDIVTAMMVPVG